MSASHSPISPEEITARLLLEEHLEFIQETACALGKVWAEESQTGISASNVIKIIQKNRDSYLKTFAPRIQEEIGLYIQKHPGLCSEELKGRTQQLKVNLQVYLAEQLPSIPILVAVSLHLVQVKAHHSYYPRLLLKIQELFDEEKIREITQEKLISISNIHNLLTIFHRSAGEILVTRLLPTDFLKQLLDEIIQLLKEVDLVLSNETRLLHPKTDEGYAYLSLYRSGLVEDGGKFVDRLDPRTSPSALLKQVEELSGPGLALIGRLPLSTLPLKTSKPAFAKTLSTKFGEEAEDERKELLEEKSKKLSLEDKAKRSFLALEKRARFSSLLLIEPLDPTEDSDSDGSSKTSSASEEYSSDDELEEINLSSDASSVSVSLYAPS